MATAGKDIRQPKPLPAPNSDFYEVYETLNAEELATLKQVRAFAGTKAAPAEALGVWQPPRLSVERRSM